MIDVVALVIGYFEADFALEQLVHGRVAARELFGDTEDGWPNPSKAVRVRMEGGQVSNYTSFSQARLEVMAYGEDPREAARVYGRLVELCRMAYRNVVTTDDGDGLLQSLTIASAGSQLYDPDIQIDEVMFFLNAAASDRAI